jgi:hypothetical protein
MVVNRKDSQEDKNLDLTTDDSFIFGSEHTPISHVLENHKEKDLDIEKREISATAGSFKCLHKCGRTG